MKKIFTYVAVAVIVFSLFSFSTENAHANCADIGGGQVVVVLYGNGTLDTAQNNLTINASGNTSGTVMGAGCEDPNAPPNPIPYCNWYGFAEGVQGDAVSVTGAFSGSIPVSVTLPAEQGSSCYDAGHDADFSGSKTFSVSTLPNGTYNLTLSVTDDDYRTATKNLSFTINRSAANYTLTVAKNGNGSGTVTGTGITCGSDCSESYTSGTDVQLQATPAGGSVFSQWSSTCPGGSVHMGQSKTCTATFNTTGTLPPSVTLTASPNPVTSGQTTSLSWTSQNTTSCTATAGTGFSTGGATNGSDVSGALSSQTTFTISCSGPGGSATDSEIVGVQGGIPGCYANPNPVNTNTVTAIYGTGGTGSYSFSAPGGTPGSGSGNPFGTSWGSEGVKTVTVTSGSQSGSCTVTVATNPPPGGGEEDMLTCSGPTRVSVNTNGTFTAAGGSGTYAWTSSPSANPATGSGSSFVTKWSSTGNKTVTVNGSASCSLCVGSTFECSGWTPPNIDVYFNCEPETQSASVQQLVNLTGSVSPSTTGFSWTATGGNPSTGSDTNFSTTYSGTGLKTIVLDKGGITLGAVTYHSDTCTVTVAPPTTGDITVNAVNSETGVPVATTWDLDGGGVSYHETVADDSRAYLNTPTGVYSISNVAIPAGYSAVVSPIDPQSLTTSAPITFTIQLIPLSVGTVTLSAAPTSVIMGAPTTLSWVTGNVQVDSCIASADPYMQSWSDAKSETGSQGTSAILENTLFSLTCQDLNDTFVSSSVLVTTHPAQCYDGISNEVWPFADGLVDFPNDPGCRPCATDSDDPMLCPDACSGANCDDNEDDAGIPQCQDNADNDGDLLTDFDGNGGAGDPGCKDANDNDERDNPVTQCNDGFDNDGDTLGDFPNDPGCTDQLDISELDDPDVEEF